MGWSIGYDNHWKRDIGYGVPAICDNPKCNEEIDRGISYVCGGEPYGGEKGCGLYFCAKHLFFGRKDTQLCSRCFYYKKSYKPKPDSQAWIKFKMKHKSWAKWRIENRKENIIDILQYNFVGRDPFLTDEQINKIAEVISISEERNHDSN